MTFHYLNTLSLVAGNQAFTLGPAAAPRYTTEADAFEWYRVKSFKFRILGLTTQSYAGFVEGKPDTLPQSGLQIMELLHSVSHLAGAETSWSRWVTVPARSLTGALPWYKTVVGTATDEEEQVGWLCLAGTGTNIVNVEFYVTVDFKGAVATANTPAMVELARKMREERLKAAAERRRSYLLLALSPGLTKQSV